MKKLVFCLCFLPGIVWADRLGGLTPNSQVLLSTQSASVNAILNQNTLQSGATFYVSSGTIDTSLIVNGNQGVSGMSYTDRGLTVNNGTYSVAGSSSQFIVMGASNRLFTADPINNVIISSGPAKFVSSSTFNGPMLGANGAGSIDQIWASSGPVLSPYWKTITSGAGTPGGSNTNVQFNNSGSFGGDSGFQYDSSVSSVTLSAVGHGGLGVGGPLLIDRADLGPGPFANRGSLLFNPNSSSPDLQIRNYGGPTNSLLSFYDYSGNLDAYFLTTPGTTPNNFAIYLSSVVGLSPTNRWIISGNGVQQLNNTSGLPMLSLDPIGNSTFTTPVVISTLTVSRQLIDSSLSSGTSGYFLMSRGGTLGPQWNPVASSGGSVSISTLTAGATNFIFNQNVLQTGSTFYVSSGTIDQSLTINGNNGSSGMSVYDRGLTVNNGSYSTAASSASFIVNGGSGQLLKVDPSTSLVTLGTTTVNGTGTVNGFLSVVSTVTTPSNITSLTTSTMSVTGGYFQYFSQTKAQIAALVPSSAGQSYYCSDCASESVCISTGTTVASFSGSSGRANQCK